MFLLSSAAVVLFVLALLFTLYLRHRIRPDRRLLDNAVDLATRLLDALEDGDEARIIAAVGGPAGVREIRRTIRALGFEAVQLLRRDPDDTDARKIVRASWWSFAVLGWSAWLEEKLRARLPAIPVISVESLAKHFTTMCATIDAIQSMYNYV